MKMRPKLEGKGQKSDIPFSGRGPRGGDPGEEAAPPPLGLLQQGKAFLDAIASPCNWCCQWASEWASQWVG